MSLRKAIKEVALNETAKKELEEKTSLTTCSLLKNLVIDAISLVFPAKKYPIYILLDLEMKVLWSKQYLKDLIKILSRKI